MLSLFNLPGTLSAQREGVSTYRRNEKIPGVRYRMSRRYWILGSGGRDAAIIFVQFGWRANRRTRRPASTGLVPGFRMC
jgi:hypothetical protein